MGIDRKNDSSQSSKLLTYLGITVTFQFIGFVSTYVYSIYFSRSATFAESFLFRSSDSPPIPLGFRRPSSFGNHFFGDYLWIYSEVKKNGFGGYFGGSQLFLVFASKFPYYFSLIILFATCVTLLYLTAKILLSEFSLPEQLAFLVAGLLLSQPVLLAIDRGQIHLLLFAFLMLGLSLLIKQGGNRTWGAILIAVAISMKLTPVFFLLLLVRKRHWRELKLSVISLVGFMLLPLVYLNSGLGVLKYALGLTSSNKEQQEMYNSVEYFTENLAYNSSFKLLSYRFSQINSALGNLGSFVYEHYFLCAGFLCIILGWLIIQKNVTQFESVLLMAIASSVLIPIAGGYTFLVFICPLVVVLADDDFRFDRLNIFYCCFIGIVLMPKQIPLSLGTFQDSSITFNGILNPSLSLIVILFIAGKCLYTSRKSVVHLSH